MLETNVSHYITSNATTLLESIPYYGFEGITLGNGDNISISSMGRNAIKFSNDCELTLQSVLYASKVAINLISINKLHA